MLALATAQRLQTLSLIKLSNIKKSEVSYVISITDLIQTSRPGIKQLGLVLPFFRNRFEICIASTLDYYLKITESLRNDTDQLFITTRKHYKAATKATLSRWIRSSLAFCDVDSRFNAHITRHAPSSAALKKSISIDLISSAACWSEKSETFFRFYNKPILNNSKDFASSSLT